MAQLTVQKLNEVFGEPAFTEVHPLGDGTYKVRLITDAPGDFFLAKMTDRGIEVKELDDSYWRPL